MIAAFAGRALMLGLALALLAGCGRRELAPPELVERAVRGSVAVEATRGATVALAANPFTGAPELVSTPETGASYGSGVVVEPGLILTSGHLVDGAAQVVVRLAGADGPPLLAGVVGVSMCDDLALLEVGGPGPRPIRLGRSAGLRVGAPVVAVGFAPGAGPAGPTVSEGLVSRLVTTPAGLPAASLLTTSASLLPGGSGGPLLSTTGEVVGIVTEGRFAGPAGRGDYVIGMDYAREVAAQLREGGSLLSLGLDLVEVGGGPDAVGGLYVRHFGPDAAAGGLFVREVGLRAATSGVRPGDLLVGAAGRSVRSLADLCGALGDPAVSLPAELEVLRRAGDGVERARAAFLGRSAADDGDDEPRAAAAQPGSTATTAATRAPAATQGAAPTAPPAPTATPLPAPVAAVTEAGPAEQEAARAALAAERARHQELFFDTFDNEATKRRWRPTDDAGARRELIYSYYRMLLKQPGAVTADAWGDRALGPRHIVEVDVALPPTGTAAVGIAYDQQADGSGLSYFVVGADGTWQHASFQGGAPVPGRYLRGASPAFVAGGGTNRLRVVRLPEGTQLWLNDTLVARADPGPFPGGHAGVIAIAGPESLPGPATMIADNFRLLEHP